jgi:hypothetical protein
MKELWELFLVNMYEILRITIPVVFVAGVFLGIMWIVFNVFLRNSLVGIILLVFVLLICVGIFATWIDLN